MTRYVLYVEQTDYRNVIDYFKGTPTAAVKEMLTAHRHDFSVAMDRFRSDFNAGQLLRNSNAFLGREVIYVGEKSKNFDRRGGVGMHHYENIVFIPGLEDFKVKLLNENRRLVIMEDHPEALALPDYRWDECSCIMIGAESYGVSEEIVEWVASGEVPGDIVFIPQYGSVRSLNAGTAAGIAMYDYCAKLHAPSPPWA